MSIVEAASKRSAQRSRGGRLPLAIAFTAVLVSGAALAATAPDTARLTGATLRDALFRQSLKKPTDVKLAVDYAHACVAVGDVEGAIGALERVLYYLPGDKATQAELGLLYAQLDSPQMAGHYLHAAADGAGLDEPSRVRVDAAASGANERAASNHIYGSLQAGLRSQSNAAFTSENDILRISNQDYIFNHPRDRESDGNGFQLAQIGYDYDLGNQRGDTIEARFAGYATQQFRLSDLNVGLYDVTVGPRLFVSPGELPGWSVKPYAAGGQIFLAGQRYLASGGAGIVADIPVRADLLLQPAVEVRRVSFANVSVFSSLNSGVTATLSVSATAIINPDLSVIGRLVSNLQYAHVASNIPNYRLHNLSLLTGPMVRF